jgi:hypothetical protein
MTVCAPRKQIRVEVYPARSKHYPPPQMCVFDPNHILAFDEARRIAANIAKLPESPMLDARWLLAVVLVYLLLRALRAVCRP